MSQDWPNQRKYQVEFTLNDGSGGTIVTNAYGIQHACIDAADTYSIMAGPDSGFKAIAVRTYPELELLWTETNTKTFGESHMTWFSVGQSGEPGQPWETDPTGVFHPDIIWWPVPDALVRFIDRNYVLTGSGKNKQWAPPNIDYFIGQNRTVLAETRWFNQQRGVTVNGILYATDKDSRDSLTSAIQDGIEYEANPKNGPGSFMINWKGVNGFTQVTLADLKSIKAAVSAHIQGCFDRELAINTQIASEFPGSSKAYADIIKRYAEESLKGWPNIPDQEYVPEEVFTKPLPNNVDTDPNLGKSDAQLAEEAILAEVQINPNPPEVYEPQASAEEESTSEPATTDAE